MNTQTLDQRRDSAGGVTSRPAPGSSGAAGTAPQPRGPAPLSHGAPAPGPGASPSGTGRNRELFEKVAARIEERPDLHKQAYWMLPSKCGTAHCIAGWAVTLEHGDRYWDDFESDLTDAYRLVHEAATLLGLQPSGEASILFAADWDPVHRHNMSVPDALRAIGAGRIDP